MKDYTDMIKAAKKRIDQKATGANIHYLCNILGEADIWNKLSKRTGEDHSELIETNINKIYKILGK